jgi:hypothetical protein
VSGLEVSAARSSAGCAFPSKIVYCVASTLHLYSDMASTDKM